MTQLPKVAEKESTSKCSQVQWNIHTTRCTTNEAGGSTSIAITLDHRILDVHNNRLEEELAQEDNSFPPRATATVPH
jgi:hypothetical protein